MSSVLSVTCDLCGENRVTYASGWRDIHDAVSFKATYHRDFCPKCWRKAIGAIEDLIRVGRESPERGGEPR